MSKLVLWSENVPGNLHQAAMNVNEFGMAEYVLAMNYTSGNYTVVVYRVPIELRDKMWKEQGRIGEPK